MSDSSEGEDWLPVPRDENQVKRERKLARQKDRQEDSEDEGSGEEFSEVVKVFADDDDDKLTFQDLGLCDVLCSTVERLEWTAPTKIQRLSLPAAFKGRDIIGLAETGSGKTGAFALPMIQALLEQPQKLFGVILTPTRELAFQIGQQFEALGASIRLLVAIIVGGVDMTTQAIALAKRPHIIVATPGRLVDHLENTKGFHLRAIKYLVMDEADRILNMDFEEEVDKILKSVNRDRKTFLFSATMTKKVAKLERASLRNPVRIEVNSRYKTVDKLKQNYVFIPQKYKEAYLVYLLNEIAGQSTIIFTQTCNNAILIALMLRQLGFGAMALHGKMPQEKRMGALNSFKGKARNILVCTDVASRGLDIPHVDVVMNYDVPMAAKDYVHRVGRTARAGRSGMAITFVTQYDVEMYQKIEVHLGKKLTEYPCVESDVMLLVERATQAMGSAKVELREMDQKRRKRGIDSDDDEQYQPARYKKRIKTAKKSTVGDQKMNNKIGTKGLRRRGNNAYVYKV